jgi:hypothetical protein
MEWINGFDLGRLLTPGMLRRARGLATSAGPTSTA